MLLATYSVQKFSYAFAKDNPRGDSWELPQLHSRMSSYLDEDSDESDAVKTYTEEEQTIAKETALASKEEGNSFFKQGAEGWDDAVKHYTTGINSLKGAGLDKDPVMATMLLNRSATYLALKRYVPALYDANIAGEIDSDNWKAFWRQGSPDEHDEEVFPL